MSGSMDRSAPRHFGSSTGRTFGGDFPFSLFGAEGDLTCEDYSKAAKRADPAKESASEHLQRPEPNWLSALAL